MLRTADSADASAGLDRVSELLSFAQDLVSATSLDDLTDRYFERIGQFVDASKQGVLLIDPVSQEIEHLKTRGLSQFFARKYERIAARQDPLLTYVLTHRVPAASWLLMSEEQWEAHPLYAEACRLHGIKTLLQTPILSSGEVVGTLFFATTDSGKLSEREVQTALILGQLLGGCVTAAVTRSSLQRTVTNLVTALDDCSDAVVLTDLETGERHANAAARRLLERIGETDRERCLDDVMAQASEVQSDGSRVSRRQVRTRSGAPSVLTATSDPESSAEDVIVSQLRLDRAPTRTIPIEALTARELEVAEYVASGLSDPGIADALCISPHTAKQHVKNIYRKLGVGSRAELTATLVRHVSRSA